MVLEDSTPRTYGLWSSTGEASLLAKTPRQQNSHLRNFSKRNLRLKASPEFLDHPKSEQVVVAQNLMGAPSSAITKKPIRETRKAKTHTNPKVVGFVEVNWWLKDKDRQSCIIEEVDVTANVVGLDPQNCYSRSVFCTVCSNQMNRNYYYETQREHVECIYTRLRINAYCSEHYLEVNSCTWHSLIKQATRFMISCIAKCKLTCMIDIADHNCTLGRPVEREYISLDIYSPITHSDE